MAEIRLLFEPAGSAGTVRPVFQRQGELDNRGEAVPLTFDLNEAERGDLRWYLEDYMDLPDHGSRVRAQRIEQVIGTWGRDLFTAVFADQVNAGLLAALLAASGPRLLTVATDDARILRLPWELMADAQGPLCRRLTIRRQLAASAMDSAASPIKLPLRILLIVSRPDDLGFIDPRLTTRSILDALQPLGEPNVAIDFCRPPTLARMEEMLSQARMRGEPYTIVHFDGHGTYDPLLNLGILCFEKPSVNNAPLDGIKTDPVRAEQMGRLLSGFKIPLAILEACRSGQMDNLAAMRGVAPRLIAAGVGSVLAMSHAVHVEAARVLLERFYRELVTGVSVGQAVDQGRAGLMAMPHRWIELGPNGRTVALQDWFLPQLYQRGEDLVVVRDAGSRLQSAVGNNEHFDVFLSHNHADKARVEAIACRLRDEHGLAVWFDAWQLTRGPVHAGCEAGIAGSRIVVIICTQAALASQWVEAERQMAHAKDPVGYNLIPVLLEDVDLPPGLKALLHYDLRDPDRDDQGIAQLAAAIGRRGETAAPRGSNRRRPPERGELGAFPRPPLHKFQGRARELYQLEQQFREHRAVVLHAMGGMGKTSLAREAAFWWTRTGLFPDGACFLSFETPVSPEQIALVLGTYLEGAQFEQLSQARQRLRACQLFTEKRVLMVWDNFESVLPSFAGASASQSAYSFLAEIREMFADWTEDENGLGRLLITCRPEETGLAGARRFELHGLARADSLHLLHRVMLTAGIEPDQNRHDRDGLARLLATLADHPLSIELVGPHLKKLDPDQIIVDFDRLLASFTGDAEVERNRSLLASLRFSTDRLSPAARQALPWLGLFQGGVFEDVLLKISQIDPHVWDEVRSEFAATALIRIEDDIQIGGRPYLRFHPTLAYAARLQGAGAKPGDLEGTAAARAPGVPVLKADDEEKDARYLAVYLGLNSAVYNALTGANPGAGIQVLSREEANFRRAVEWAVAKGQYRVAAPMGETFLRYLESSFRLQERDQWVAWLAAEARQAGWSEQAADAEMEASWSLFSQGQAREAIARLTALIARLQITREFDPAFQLAAARMQLGRVYVDAGLAARAIPFLEEAVRDWERLLAQATGPAPAGTNFNDFARAGNTRRNNLAAALSDLANALYSAGRLDEALDAAERGVAIATKSGNARNEAAGLGQIAIILMHQGRYGEADARYDQALAAARKVIDKELEGSLLQNQGILANDRCQYVRARELYKQALKLFQEANAEANIMRTCNLLGVVEQNQGRLAEARAWYERSREIAHGRADQKSFEAAAQNLGIVCQLEGEQHLQQGQADLARQRFEEAEQFMRESLQLAIDRADQPGQAASLSQLAELFLVQGQLDKAAEHGRQALAIQEALGDLRGLSITFQTLKQIALAQNDSIQAAAWETKERAVDAELARRAHGGEAGAGALPEQMAQMLGQLALACVRAAANGEALPAEAEQLLAQLDAPEAGPLQPLAPWLRRLASAPAGELVNLLAAPPANLPEPLPDVFAQLRTAVQEAFGA